MLEIKITYENLYHILHMILCNHIDILDFFKKNHCKWPYFRETKFLKVRSFFFFIFINNVSAKQCMQNKMHANKSSLIKLPKPFQSFKNTVFVFKDIYNSIPIYFCF